MFQVIGLRGLFNTVIMKSLVIGMGLLGSAIANEIVKRKGKKKIIIATRDFNKNEQNYTHLDLTNVNSWNVPNDVDIAYFCAGVSKKDKCDNSYKEARLINVINTLAIMNKLLDKKIFVVFLSSNGVFQGIKPFYRINDNISPSSYYAELKAEVEGKISMYKNPYSIVRLTKVFDSRLDLINAWINNLKEKKRIIAFNDITISPVSSNYAGEFIFNIGDKHNNGVFHLSGQENHTYYEIALMIAKKIGVSSSYVQGIECTNGLPKYASLDMSQNTCNFPCYPQSISSMIDDIF